MYGGNDARHLRGHERQPPSRPKGEKIDESQPHHGAAGGQGKPPGRPHSQSNQPTEGAPHENPDNLLPSARRRRWRRTLQADPEELANNLRVEGDAGDLLLDAEASTVGSEEVVFDALGGDADEHDLVADRLRADRPGQQRR